jgi:hypothetical protein
MGDLVEKGKLVSESGAVKDPLLLANVILTEVHTLVSLVGHLSF